MARRRLAVLGLGHFGMSFLKSVDTTRYEVIAIDRRDEAIDEVATLVDHAVVIDATDRDSLVRVGAADADLAVVSVGSELDRSILAVLHLKQLGVDEIYVKAVSDDHGRVLTLIGATRILHPERELAEQLAESLNHPGLRRLLPLVGDYVIVEMAAPKALQGKSLSELSLRSRHSVSVIAMGRIDTVAQLRAPEADEPIVDGDLLMLIGHKGDLDAFEVWTRQR